ncbi:MAG: Gfo/Idh/MocA family oxidoreductase, partial [Anaerolineae bacterium]|nr:Gfo/Idh/MocA family oxidoreductase [Anaerolineae bacterium]
MRKLRLAIVGCGEIANYMAWLSLLVPRVTLVACCARSADRVGAFARRHRIPHAFTDYSELLAGAEVDAVYLAVPHHLHEEMTLAAVQAGKAVLLEKPLARTLEEGRRLVQAVAGHKVGVNYQYRYDSAAYALAQAVRAGALGRVHSVRIDMPWHRERAYFERSPWHCTLAEAGGGTLITQGSHFLDLALWALDEGPRSAMGYIATPGFEVEVETLAHGIVETTGGTLISIISSMVAHREQAVTIIFYGEKGTAIYRDRPWPSVHFLGVKVRRQRPPVWGVHALQRSLAAFAAWVLDD